MGSEIIFILRLIVPFLIFRYPLFGGVLAMLLDGLDVVFIEIIGKGTYPQIDSIYDQYYHKIDKYLDMYYLSFAFIVSLKWAEQLARKTSIALFMWRLIGFILFEITQIRWLLFVAPNLFENFYLFYLAARKLSPNWEVKNGQRLAIILTILYIPKFLQEYILHIKEAAPWTWYYENYVQKGRAFWQL